MFGLFLYFTMDLTAGSLMLPEIGSQLAYSAILKLLPILGMKAFRVCAVKKLLAMISSFSVKVRYNFFK